MDDKPIASDCPHCSEHFESKNALKKHIRKVHSEHFQEKPTPPNPATTPAPGKPEK